VPSEFDTAVAAIGPRSVWQIALSRDQAHAGLRTAQTTPPLGYPLTDHGGSTISWPKLALVYLGPWFGNTTKLEQFAKELMENGYLAPLSTYGSGVGTYLGSFHGPTMQGTVTDSFLQTTLAQLISTGVVPAPDGHTLYALCLPSGVTVSQGGSNSCSSFCGYHDALSSNLQAFYTVQPATDCGGCNEGDAFAGFTTVLAHEVAEACTDAIPGQGWYNDQTGMENADEWAWPSPLRSYGPWKVQGYQVNGIGEDFGPYTVPPVPVPVPNPQPPPVPNPRAVIDGIFATQIAAIQAEGTGDHGLPVDRPRVYAFVVAWVKYIQNLIAGAFS
jgi:hypothetical protein